MQEEAKEIASNDFFMTDLMDYAILFHRTFYDALVSNLARQLACSSLGESKWLQLFRAAVSLTETEEEASDDFCITSLVEDYKKGLMRTLCPMAILDLLAIKERDPATEGLVNPFLNFKGYKALQCHRIAYFLFKAGRKDAARTLQSRASELYCVDIHPAAVIGPGLFIDHGSGVVIGETAVIGSNCSFLHNVTLGSTGKDRGDRHPKLGNDVLVGCNATILGNISIGHSCKIGSGSMVLKSLPPCVTAVGNPARIVGRSCCPKAASGMDHALQYVETKEGISYTRTWSTWMDASDVFSEAGTHTTYTHHSCTSKLAHTHNI